MRGSNGKNISLSGITTTPCTQMDTAKAHIHIAMRCELTAVFLCAISCGDFESVRKLSLYLLYFKVQRYCNSFTLQNIMQIIYRLINISDL